MPWLLVIQVTLLVVWYTIAPTIPAWLVFLPVIIAGTIWAVIGLAALAAIVWAVKQ